MVDGSLVMGATISLRDVSVIRAGMHALHCSDEGFLIVKKVLDDDSAEGPSKRP